MYSNGHILFQGEYIFMPPSTLAHFMICCMIYGNVFCLSWSNV
jgi:hypothetical protein